MKSKALTSSSQVAQNSPAMWETWVQSVGQEDLLEKEMVTHYSILACEIPRTEEPGGLQSMGSQSMGSQRVGHDLVTNTFTFSLSMSISILS